MKLPSIEECSKRMRLLYTFLIDIAITTIAALMMPGAMAGYYNNFVLHSPTQWYGCPKYLLDWCPVVDVVVFVIVFVSVYIALWFVAYNAKED